MGQKILFSWSGGKDSAMALHQAVKSRDYEIAALLTTVTEGYDRISMHGVRVELLEKQAKSLDLPLEKIIITKNADNEEYAAKMEAMLRKYKEQHNITGVAFGDIFLEDLKKYREDNLAKIGLKGFFPIWKRDSVELAGAFIELGFKAVLTCVDSQKLDGKFAGREYDERLLADLPPDVDPCGENGEFHSFVYDGPIFSERINFTIGETVLRDERFYFCDLVPGHAV